jgi:hypothetical protein
MRIKTEWSEVHKARPEATIADSEIPARWTTHKIYEMISWNINSF